MRIVVYGAGAVGGLIGARLFQAGTDVVLIARGAHHDAIRDRGLRVLAPDGDDVTLAVPVVDHPRALAFTDDDVVCLSMKTQHTAAALADLTDAVAGRSIAVLCAQNGVENERLALRCFGDVYGMCVMCPAGHLEPGMVEAFGTPYQGLLDLGRYPNGVDERARAIVAALEGAGFSSLAQPDIMRWKYRKLINNLANATNALCGSGPALAEIAGRARAEADAVLRAAGIDAASAEEDAERRGELMRLAPERPGHVRGSSTWQSLRRGTGSVETDYLNGEIALLGRLHGVPTPVNQTLQRLCAEQAHANRPAGSLDPAELLARLG
jgi:2-dehydropantoate 2-reductase